MSEFLDLELAMRSLTDKTVGGKYDQSASILEHILSDTATTGAEKASEIAKLIREGTAGYRTP